MELVLENISDTIIMINNKGKYTYMNKTGKEKLAPYTNDFKGMKVSKAYGSFKMNDINGNELAFEDIPAQRILRGEKVDNYIIVGTSNLPTTYHECNGTPFYDEDGNLDGGVLIYKDIEDSYRIEEYYAFKKNIKNIFLNYASLSPDNFKIKYINETGFKSITRSKPEIESVLEVMGKNFFEFYHNENDGLIEEIVKSIEEKEPYSHKQKFIERGEIKHVKSIFQPIFNLHGDLEKIIAVGIDITEEELDKENLTNILKVQDEIFINTSHELKTPLNLIFSASQLLDMYLKKDCLENFKDDIINSNKTIMQNCYRLTKLINNILDISKMDSGFYKLNLTDNNIVNVVENIVDSVAEYTKARGLRIIFDTEIEEIIIAFDIYKIERVLLNLISNSIKFSSCDGIILVKLIQIHNMIEISVKDNGIGIDSRNLDIIFDKFIQLDTSLNRISEGAGIGLSLVKSIINLHKGTISVESICGEGSTFKILLPILTVGNEEIHFENDNNVSKVEMIKFELSDIYN